MYMFQEYKREVSLEEIEDFEFLFSEINLISNILNNLINKYL